MLRGKASVSVRTCIGTMNYTFAIFKSMYTILFTIEYNICKKYNSIVISGNICNTIIC